MRECVAHYQRNPKVRKALWICLLGMTIAILLFPITVSPDYPLPVQTVHMFSNLGLFIALFYAWILVLLFLLFTGQKHKGEMLAICLVFAVVFLGFWTIASPQGSTGDGIWQMAHVDYIQQTGGLPDGEHLNLSYFDFPGLHLLTVPMVELCDVSVTNARMMFLLANSLLFAFLLYTAYLRLLGSPVYASLGAILVIASSSMIGRTMSIFHPIALAATFIALFTIIVVRSESTQRPRWESTILFLILTAAATIGYLFTPVLMFSVCLSIVVLYGLFRRGTSWNLKIALIPIVFMFSWQFYHVSQIYSLEILFSRFPVILEDIASGDFFAMTGQTMSGNYGEAYPWWGNAARLLWWATVYGFGSVFMFSRVPFFRRYGHSDRIMLAGFVGIVLTILIGALTLRGAMHGGFSRYLWIGGIFIIPGLISFFCNHNIRTIRPYLLVITCLALLALCLPTFLTNVDTFCVHYIYSSECSAGEFCQTAYGNTESINIYGLGTSANAFIYYMPNADLAPGPMPQMITEEECWGQIQTNLDQFWRSSRESSLFVASTKMKLPYQEWLGITPDHYEWRIIESDLLLNSNAVYENSHVKLFSPRR